MSTYSRYKWSNFIELQIDSVIRLQYGRRDGGTNRRGAEREEGRGREESSNQKGYETEGSDDKKLR